MPIQQNPNKRRGEERSETLIIPHITREMLEVARAMAEKGASRAEIEAALAAMQTGKAPAAPAAPAPEKQPGAPQQPAPGRSDAALQRRHHPDEPPAVHCRGAPRHAGGGPAPPG